LPLIYRIGLKNKNIKIVRLAIPICDFELFYLTLLNM
jgi:hypothetical protein